MEGNIGLVMSVSIINIAEMQPWKRKNIPMFNGTTVALRMSTTKSSKHRRDKFLFKVSSPDDDKLMKHLDGFS